jgi:polar amino acid transport system substrate-binding protein
VLFADVPNAIQALNNKTIDAVICDGPVAGHYAFVDKTFDLKLATVLKTEDLELYGIAVKKGNKPLLNRLNRAITAVQSKNKDIEFQEKWFSGLLGKDAQ